MRCYNYKFVKPKKSGIYTAIVVVEKNEFYGWRYFKTEYFRLYYDGEKFHSNKFMNNIERGNEKFKLKFSIIGWGQCKLNLNKNVKPYYRLKLLTSEENYHEHTGGQDTSYWSPKVIARKKERRYYKDCLLKELNQCHNIYDCEFDSVLRSETSAYRHKFHDPYYWDWEYSYTSRLEKEVKTKDKKNQKGQKSIRYKSNFMSELYFHDMR